MIDEPHTEINFRWEVLHDDGDTAVVEEYVDDVLKTTYGPMPRDATGPFIADCKARLKNIFARLLEK